jgi:hypothetical protein
MFEINFVIHEILHKIKTGYIQTDERRFNTQYKSNKKQKMGTYARRNQHTNTNALFILTVTIPHWRFIIFNNDMIWPIMQRQRYYETHRTR